ncbi:hypothetical protein WK62_19720 [Burkholderia ubonensis]|nr:hypothetical protein WK62_19720 [Burkholderia ubonensis]
MLLRQAFDPIEIEAATFARVRLVGFRKQRIDSDLFSLTGLRCRPFVPRCVFDTTHHFSMLSCLLGP